jgi:hypothetical protein
MYIFFKLRLLKISLIITLLCLTGCALFSRNYSDNIPVNENQVNIPNPKVAQDSNTSLSHENETTIPVETGAIENPLVDLGSDEITISWVKPEVKVDGYLLRYGFSSNNLDQLKSIKASELTEVEDEQNGVLYNYVLGGIEPTKVIYFTLQSLVREALSQPTPIRIVAPVGGVTE